MRPMLCQLAPADMLALKYPLAAELKYNGIRCIAVVNKKKCVLYSRNGKYFENFEEIRLGMQDGKYEDGVYDGEIVSSKGLQELLLRANAEKNTHTDTPIEYKIFDRLTHAEWADGISYRTYEERCIKAKIGERVVIKNPVDLKVYYNYVLKSGWEGLIVKALNSTYVSGRNNCWFKIKPKETLDMRIMGFDPGCGNYNGMLGAIQCQFDTQGEIIHAYVSTGFTEEQRKDIWERRKELLNAIVEIEFQEVTKTDREGVKCLRFATFKCLRIDK